MATYTDADEWVKRALREGMVIPAHPLALTAERKLDARRQRALTRYYHEAGVGGLAVGVHTTQFAIRHPAHNLLRPVLELAAETVMTCDGRSGGRTVLIAGVCGPTKQAVAEGEQAVALGYHAGLLSLGALREASEGELLKHCRAVAAVIPLFGFYLQPSVGGRILSREFWRGFLEIPNVVGIKIAPFNRYQTLDVIVALAEAGRERDVPLYTGNDDNIIVDLLTSFGVTTSRGNVPVRMAGGLLGQWACGTRRAVEMLELLKKTRLQDQFPARWLTEAAQLTEFNGAIFDVAHGFAGCIPGIHEVLRRQGLLAGLWCLAPEENLSPGQAAAIDGVCRKYPQFTDDEFVSAHLDHWLE